MNPTGTRIDDVKAAAEVFYSLIVKRKTALPECGCRKRTRPKCVSRERGSDVRNLDAAAAISPGATRPGWQLLPADANRDESLIPELRRRPDRPHSVQSPPLSL